MAIHSVHIDPDGVYMAAVNSKVKAKCKTSRLIKAHFTTWYPGLPQGGAKVRVVLSDHDF